MKRALVGMVLALAACNEPLEGPQPDQKIVPKAIEGPPPSHRPNVNPEKAIAPAPVLAEPPPEPVKPAEPAPEPEKEPAKAPAKKAKAKSKRG